MKKMSVISVLVLFLLIFWAKPTLAGVFLYFDFQGVSETYVKFTYEFGSQFGPRAKRYYFLGEYKVKILEGMAFIKYQDRMEEEQVIVALINEEKSPFIWVKVRDLDSEEKIREKAKEFSDKVFEKLKILERLEELERKKQRQLKYLGLLGLYPRALFDLCGG